MLHNNAHTPHNFDFTSFFPHLFTSLSGNINICVSTEISIRLLRSRKLHNIFNESKIIQGNRQRKLKSGLSYGVTVASQELSKTANQYFQTQSFGSLQRQAKWCVVESPPRRTFRQNIFRILNVSFHRHQHRCCNAGVRHKHVCLIQYADTAIRSRATAGAHPNGCPSFSCIIPGRATVPPPSAPSSVMEISGIPSGEQGGERDIVFMLCTCTSLTWETRRVSVGKAAGKAESVSCYDLFLCSQELLE